MQIRLDVLVGSLPARSLSGRALHLQEPISFWGGISPEDGSLIDPRNTLRGESVTGRVLFVRELRGSSSGSSVLLELVYKRIAPAAIVLAEADAVLALGALVAREMDWPTPGIFRLPFAEQLRVPPAALVSIQPDGQLTIES